MGGEFTSNSYKSFCLEAGIVQRFTQPHTPQSNSFVKRYNRILGERARAMLYGGHLPISYGMKLWKQSLTSIIV